jgi:hypothetical protein
MLRIFLLLLVKLGFRRGMVGEPRALEEGKKFRYFGSLGEGWGVGDAMGGDGSRSRIRMIKELLILAEYI